MSHRASRKAPNVYTVLVAILAALTASGAVLGTVLLTRAPGATLGHKSAIVRALSLDFIGSFDSEEGQDNDPLTADPTVPKSGQALIPGLAGAVRRFWTDAGGANNTLTMATASEIQIYSDEIAFRSLGNSAVGIDLSGANTRSGETTSSGGTLLLASGSTANGGVSAAGTATTLVIDPDGTWAANANGNWSATTNWSGGIVADGGGFANFSTLNITANVTVTIDTTSRTVRRIDIGDTNDTNSYTINRTGSATLIFDNTANSSNAQLNEVLNSHGDTISAPIVLNSSLDITNASAATLTLSAGITSGTAGTKTITTSTGAVTISGVIGDGGGIIAVTQNGSGTLTLNGTNTFSGVLTVQDGTLSIATVNNSGSNGVLGNSTNAVFLGGSGTTGTLEYTGGNASSTKKFTMATGGTGVFQVDTAATTLALSGVIDGGGALTKSGAGTLTLSGTNTYSGGTTLSAGTLNIDNASALGTGAFTIVGGTIDNTSGSAVALTNAQTWNGNFAFTGTNNLTFSGAVTLGGNRIVTVNGGTLTESGAISGTGFGLTKAGAGTLTLSGTNTYSGVTDISAGTLELGSGGTTGSLSTSSTITDNATFTINRSNAVTQGTDFSGNAITGTGSLIQAGTGTTTLNAANTYSGATTISAGILNIQNATALGTTAGGTTVSSGATLQLQGGIAVGAEALTLSGTGAAGQNGALVNVSGTNDYGGPITLAADTTISSNSDTLNLSGTVDITSKTLTVSGSGDTLITGVISGSGASSTLTKSGGGTLTVNVVNTYGGGTQVNGGTLLVNNTSGSGTGTGAVTVNNGGTTLGGTGTISGAVTVGAGANLAPGNGGHTTAIFTVGTLTMEPNSNYLVDINGTTPGTGYDQVNITGAGATRLTLTNSNLVVTVGTTLSLNQTFTIVTVTGGGGYNTTQFAQGNSVTSGRYTFSITYPNYHVSDDLILTVTATPEPSTWVGGAFAFAALAFTQRRRVAHSLKRIALRSLNKS